MTTQYVQTCEVALRRGARRDQILGMVFQLMGLGMIPIAIYLSYWVFIAVAVPIIFGAWLTQRFYSSAREFEYAFTGSRLIVSRTNIAGRGRRMLDIALSDVTSFSKFYDMVMPGDLVAAENVNEKEVCALIFRAGGSEFRLLFSPDGYLTALLKEKFRNTPEIEVNV